MGLSDFKRWGRKPHQPPVGWEIWIVSLVKRIRLCTGELTKLLWYEYEADSKANQFWCTHPIWAHSNWVVPFNRIETLLFWPFWLRWEKNAANDSNGLLWVNHPVSVKNATRNINDNPISWPNTIHVFFWCFDSILQVRRNSSIQGEVFKGFTCLHWSSPKLMFIPLRETSLQTTRLLEFEVATDCAHGPCTISIGSNGWQKSLARGFFTLLLHFPGHPCSIAIHGWLLLVFYACATCFCEDQHPTFTAKSRKFFHDLLTCMYVKQKFYPMTTPMNQHDGWTFMAGKSAYHPPNPGKERNHLVSPSRSMRPKSQRAAFFQFLLLLWEII